MNKEQIKVSILIAALEEERWIGHAVSAALASVSAAGLRGEVIVCDGGSQDATRERAKRSGALVLQAPKGRAKQLNAGLRAARGDWVMLLHADALCNPRMLEAADASLERGAVAREHGAEAVDEAPQDGVVADLDLLDALALAHAEPAFGDERRARLGRGHAPHDPIFGEPDLPFAAHGHGQQRHPLLLDEARLEAGQRGEARQQRLERGRLGGGDAGREGDDQQAEGAGHGRSDAAGVSRILCRITFGVSSSRLPSASVNASSVRARAARWSFVTFQTS